MVLDDPEKLKSLASDRGEIARMKRFYETAAAVAQADGFTVKLDGRPIKTPMKAAFILPRAELAEAVAGEWARQAEFIEPDAMPLTRLANTAIDRVMPDEPRIIAEICEYAGSDLLCYRADDPEELVSRQAQAWDPILDWCKQEIGAGFTLISGIMPETQPDQSLQMVAGHLAGKDAYCLTAVHNITTLTGSAILATAIEAGHIDADMAWRAAHVDEDWNAELWGRDAEATRQRARRRSVFDAAVELLSLA